MRSNKHTIAVMLMVFGGCFSQHDVGDQNRGANSPDPTLGFTPSNGVRWFPGTDASKTTTLSGNCEITPERGEITCDQLTIRLNTPGVWEGLGWEEIAQASNCAGTALQAPRLSIFSFGNLSVAPGTKITSPFASNDVVVLVAAHRIDWQGQINPGGGAQPTNALSATPTA